jgi:hypothetical protein
MAGQFTAACKQSHIIKISASGVIFYVPEAIDNNEQLMNNAQFIRLSICSAYF